MPYTGRSTLGALNASFFGASAETMIEAAKRLMMAVARALLTIAYGRVITNFLLSSVRTLKFSDPSGNETRSVCGGGEVPNNR
jgi:hypothetical protein